MDRVKLPDFVSGEDYEGLVAEVRVSRDAGRLLKRMREKSALSQADLAKKLKVSQSWISQAESGKVESAPSLGFMARFAAACSEVLLLGTESELSDHTTSVDAGGVARSKERSSVDAKWLKREKGYGLPILPRADAPVMARISSAKRKGLRALKKGQAVVMDIKAESAPHGQALRKQRRKRGAKSKSPQHSVRET